MRLIRVLGVFVFETLLVWGVMSMVASAEEAVSNTMLQTPHWVVWYGDDGRIYRQRVDVNAYMELRQSLRQARAEDLQRLKDLAVDYLRVDLQPVFTDLSARREGFLISVFDFGTSSSLLGTALSAAEKAKNLQDEEEIIGQVREATAKEMVARFRAQLIAPQTMLRALRSAAGRSLILLKQDLLQNCDRYDRAFRGLVLESTNTMETLDAATGWRVDIAWRPETATFRSLCAGLRQVDPGIYVVESSLLEAFSNSEPSMYSEALELVLPIAKTAIDLSKYTESMTDSLNTWWLPKSWTHVPATFVSYIAHTRILARRVGERLNVRRSRPRLRLTLQSALEGLQADLTERLRHTCDEFIIAELERVELGLAARGEGVWSTPP
jgi:cellobiose-specific phosphotransferase system component IIB